MGLAVPTKRTTLQRWLQLWPTFGLMHCGKEMLHIGYLDEAVPAELLDARVEELARIIRAQQARRSRRRLRPTREGA